MRMTETAAAALLVAAMVPCAAFAQPVGEADSALSFVPTSVDVLVAPDEEQSTVLVEAETISAESTLAADDAEIRAYVSRLYQLVMDREPDAAGLAVQVEGVKTMGAGQIAYNFFNSAEFENKNLTNRERVEIAYNVLLDRASDAAGMEMWLSYLENGMTIKSVVAGFIESPEFVSLCDGWGSMLEM